MWRILAVSLGGGLGLLIGMINPDTPLKIHIILLMLVVGIKMIWRGIKTLPDDADSQYTAGTTLILANSINLFLGGLAMGLMGKSVLFAPLFRGFSTLLFQSISKRFASGPLRENSTFRPVVVGGILVLTICILHFTL